MPAEHGIDCRPQVATVHRNAVAGAAVVEADPVIQALLAVEEEELTKPMTLCVLRRAKTAIAEP